MSRLLPSPRPLVFGTAVAVAAMFAASHLALGSGQAPVAAQTSAAANPNGLGRSLPARLPSSSGKGGTYWVDGSHGSDRSRGTRKRPWKTINHALARVPRSGSVINVMPGTYRSQGENYALRFSRRANVRDPITVRAYKRGSVTIENADTATETIGAWVIHATGLRISGFRFRILANLDSAVVDEMLIQDSSRIEVSHCIFNETGGMGVAVRGGANSSADDVWLIDNIFRPRGTNSTTQVTGLAFPSSTYFGSKGSHWVYAGQYDVDGNSDRTSGSRRLVIVNNVFSGTAAGRDVELGPQARNSFVVDNTLYGNHSAAVIGPATDARYAGQGVVFFSDTESSEFTNGYNVVANNLFLDMDGHAVSGSGPPEPGNLVLHNLFWGILGGDSTGNPGDPLAPENDGSVIFSLGPANRTANPQLQGVAAYDFRPPRRSPAVHGATPDYAYRYDAAGTPRPSAPSIGAFEPACESRC